MRSQDLHMQKVQTSLIKAITGVVLTTNKILSSLDSIPEGILANAKKEINMPQKS